MRTGQELQAESCKILVTGASGQIGAEYVPFLRERFGNERVVASDVRTSRKLCDDGPFVYCDVQDKDNLARIMLENGITTVVHLATILSGTVCGLGSSLSFAMVFITCIVTPRDELT